MLSKGIALKLLGRNEEAIVVFERAIEFKPGNAEAWNHKGITLYELGHNEEAIAAYEKALAVNPKFAEVWYNKGNGFKLHPYSKRIVPNTAAAPTPVPTTRTKVSAQSFNKVYR